MEQNSNSGKPRKNGRVVLFAILGVAVVAAGTVAITTSLSSTASPVAASPSTVVAVPAAALAPKGPVYLGADLTGAQEVPVSGGPAAGSPIGEGTALVKVDGDKVSFKLTWTGISTPTLGHIHQGPTGANGPVVVPLFATPMPDTVDAANGEVTVTDSALATQLSTQPAGFYVNLHSKEFPGGALRGQLKAVDGHQDDMRAWDHKGQLQSADTGANEVPVADGPKSGDPDGQAVATVDFRDGSLDYSFVWTGIGEPTAGHIHWGPAGQNGEVRVPLFGTEVPANISAVSGTVPTVAPDLISAIKSNPGTFYTNLHTAEFPGGAVRGQLQK
jgi:hypothetical protein